MAAKAAHTRRATPLEIGGPNRPKRVARPYNIRQPMIPNGGQMTKYVYDFTEGDKDQKDLLGGKGANLALSLIHI